MVLNRSRNNIRRAEISLMGIERATAGGLDREEAFEIARGYLPAPDPSAGSQDIQFGINLDPCPAPCVGLYSSVDLLLEDILDIALAFDARIQIPLDIE
jgi:hypothetical protein